MTKRVNYSGGLCILLLLICHIESRAQEFWMQPDKYVYKVGDTARIDFQVGRNFSGETWNLRADRVDKAMLFSTTKPTDLKSQLHEGKEHHLKLPLKEGGTYVLVTETDKGFIEMPSDKFNAYLKEYALDNATNQRKKTNALNAPGKEFYTRNTKLLIQVGDRVTDTYKTTTGMPLEIIPEVNPAACHVGDVVHFKILFEGKPLFGARAFVWNNKDHRIYSQPIYSQQDGRVEARLFSDGEWMISVVWMVPSKDPRADWQSYWGSLIFNVQ